MNHVLHEFMISYEHVSFFYRITLYRCCRVSILINNRDRRTRDVFVSVPVGKTLENFLHEKVTKHDPSTEYMSHNGSMNCVCLEVELE